MPSTTKIAMFRVNHKICRVYVLRTFFSSRGNRLGRDDLTQNVSMTHLVVNPVTRKAVCEQAQFDPPQAAGERVPAEQLPDLLPEVREDDRQRELRHQEAVPQTTQGHTSLYRYNRGSREKKVIFLAAGTLRGGGAKRVCH